jgi:lactoylglutathione lyase
MATATFAYTIIYVPDVEATIAWYETVFGLERRFVAEDGSYGELQTGSVTLSFASEELGEKNLPGGYTRHRKGAIPFAYEIAFATSDVSEIVEKAIQQGGTLVTEPEQKPWGQTVAYVFDPVGILIEICTPMSG